MRENGVSIIMPSLNVAPYIENCLESVVNQSLKEIEIICVDAGSTDGTYEILQRYSKVDNRIKVFSVDKRSYGYQINYGMEKATSPYVGIVDTDDMVSSTMYELLYEIAIKEDADFVKGNYSTFYETNEVNIIEDVFVLTDKNLYEKTINIMENPVVFLNCSVANWCGIYKVDYLRKNMICHNETKGASFQDAGFWFQAYMHAKRAYFVNQSMYRYRVDNPNSSVQDNSKVYCICDEFDFVINKIMQAVNYEQYTDIFAQTFFEKYLWNLERISEEDKVGFLKKFASDFKGLVEKSWIHSEKWDASKKFLLNVILDDAECFYQRVEQENSSFIASLEKHNTLIIYGFGNIGKRIYDGIKDKNRIVCFAITEARDVELFGDKRVVNIESILDRDIPILIAVKNNHYKEQMESRATKLGFRTVITIPETVFLFA